MQSRGGWLGSCPRGRSLSGVKGSSESGQGECCAVREGAEAGELQPAPLSAPQKQGDVTGYWERRGDVVRCGAEQVSQVARGLNSLAISLPGIATPQGLGTLSHVMICWILCKMLAPILSAAASGARNCCSEQAGPVGSSAGVSQMCWWSTDTGAAARALPADGWAGTRAIFVQCNLLTGPAVPSPVFRW